MSRSVWVAGLLGSVCLAGCTSDASSEERSLSLFAQKVQRQIEVATDPAAVKQNELSAQEVSACVERLERRRAVLREHAAGSQAERLSSRQRIELIRIERQLQMIDRLLLRYEQNAPSVASTH